MVQGYVFRLTDWAPQDSTAAEYAAMLRFLAHRPVDADKVVIEEQVPVVHTDSMTVFSTMQGDPIELMDVSKKRLGMVTDLYHQGWPDPAKVRSSGARRPCGGAGRAAQAHR